MRIRVVLAIGLSSLRYLTESSAWQSAGYFVTSASSINEAIEHLRMGDFDLLLMGHSIPAESRERLSFLIRASGSRIPIAYVVNANSDCDDFVDANLRNEPDDLLKGIDELLADHARMRAFGAMGQNYRNLESRKSPETTAGCTDAVTSITQRKGPYSCGSVNLGENTRVARGYSTELNLRGAIDRSEMALHYQPKVDLNTGTIIGAEALSRWVHPTRGNVPPSLFIPIAEQSGEIISLGAWVLKQACTQAREWVDAGLPKRVIAVNISENQLLDKHFLDVLFATLEATGLDSENLELDVSIGVLLKHIQRVTDTLKSAKDKGVKVSADNLGTGYSSFGTLRKLPLDSVKLDRSSVLKVTCNLDFKSKVGAMIHLGHRMNLRVIAHGVETAEHLEFLWDHSCDEAQGYYFGHPVPSQQLSSCYLTRDVA